MGRSKDAPSSAIPGGQATVTPGVCRNGVCICPKIINFKKREPCKWFDYLSTLRCYYEYETNAKRFGDLKKAGCKIYEFVEYDESGNIENTINPPPKGPPFNYKWPDPPWKTETNNPTDEDIPFDKVDTKGLIIDDHGDGTIKEPYVTEGFASTQRYELRCPCRPDPKDHQVFGGPFQIFRQVWGAGSVWRYWITKHGDVGETEDPLPISNGEPLPAKQPLPPGDR